MSSIRRCSFLGGTEGFPSFVQNGCKWWWGFRSAKCPNMRFCAGKAEHNPPGRTYTNSF